MNLFYLQLLTSFFIGGGVIAIISFVVEKIDKKYAGLILGSPTTVVLSLFFLGITIGNKAVVKTIPAVFLPLGISVLFSPIYFYTAVYLSRFHFPKLIEILTTYTISISIWLLLITPILNRHFSNLFLGILGCLLLIILTQYLFNLFPHKNVQAKRINYTTTQKLGRGVFIGLIIATVVYLGKTRGSIWAGVFSVFPAVFTSTLPIFHWYNNASNMWPLIKGVPVGSLSVLFYVFTCLYTFPAFGFVWGTIVSYLLSLIFIGAYTNVIIKTDHG